MIPLCAVPRCCRPPDKAGARFCRGHWVLVPPDQQVAVAESYGKSDHLDAVKEAARTVAAFERAPHRKKVK